MGVDKSTWFEVGKCYYPKSSDVPEMLYCLNKDEEHLRIKFAYIEYDLNADQNVVCIVSADYRMVNSDEAVFLFRPNAKNRQIMLLSSLCVEDATNNPLQRLDTFSHS